MKIDEKYKKKTSEFSYIYDRIYFKMQLVKSQWNWH